MRIEDVGNVARAIAEAALSHVGDGRAAVQLDELVDDLIDTTPVVDHRN